MELLEFSMIRVVVVQCLLGSLLLIFRFMFLIELLVVGSSECIVFMSFFQTEHSPDVLVPD